MSVPSCPRYFGVYRTGDTVPLELFQQACETCSEENETWSSDANFWRLKPDREELELRLDSIAKELEDISARLTRS